MPLLDQGPAPAPELDPFTLRRAAEGDKRAFRHLVETYEAKVRAVVGRMWLGRSRHEVDDLCQECFLRVYRALPGFDPDGTARLSTWILTIATRLTIDELRKRRPVTHAASLDTAVTSPVAPASSGADACLRRTRLRRAMHDALLALKPEHRAIFVLHVFEGLSYVEISVALEVELGTVKSRLGRARARLRRELAPLKEEMNHV